MFASGRVMGDEFLPIWSVPYFKLAAPQVVLMSTTTAFELVLSIHNWLHVSGGTNDASTSVCYFIRALF